MYNPDPTAFTVDYDKVLSNLWQQGLADTSGRSAAKFNLAPADTSNAAAIRQQQLAALAGLKSRAEGTAGPSQAEMLVDRERDKNIKQAMALAASSRGISPGAAMRQAQEQAGEAGIAAAQQGAQIRAQEQEASEKAYTEALSGVRSQDYAQLGLEQERDIAGMQASLTAELQQRQLNDQMVQYYTNMGMSLEQAQLQADIAQEQMKAEQQMAMNQAMVASGESSANRKSSILGSLLTGAGMLGAAALMSDRRVKKNIKKDDSDIGEFMDALESYKYEYKDQALASGKQHGIMVQDLEKSGAGKTIVLETPIGKAIDTRKAIGPILSSLASLNKRQKRVEKLLGR